MAPIVSLALLAATLIGVMSAPVTRDTPTEVVAAAVNTHNGFATIYNDRSIRGACPDVEYSTKEAFASVSAAQFGAVKNDTSICGKFVKVNRADTLSKHYIYKIVDLCKDCDEDELDLSEKAIREFTNSDRVAIDWEFVENENESSEEDTKTSKKPLAKPIKSEKESLKNKDEDENDDDEDKGHNGATFRGRGTWFSDTMGSCGERFSQEDMIVALNEAQMGRMWGEGSKCGAKIRVSVKGSSKSVVVRVVDTCPHRYCNHGQLDLSRAAFKQFAPMDKGILDLEWSFV